MKSLPRVPHALTEDRKLRVASVAGMNLNMIGRRTRFRLRCESLPRDLGGTFIAPSLHQKRYLEAHYRLSNVAVERRYS